MMAGLFCACLALLFGALRLRKMGASRPGVPACAACVEVGDFVALTSGLVLLGLGLAMVRGAA